MTTLHLVAVHATPLLASGEAKKSGPIGFAVILVLCVACYFLFKSMSKHLRKVREDFPSGQESGPASGAAAAQGAEGTEGTEGRPAGAGPSDSPGEVGIEPRERT